MIWELLMEVLGWCAMAIAVATTCFIVLAIVKQIFGLLDDAK